ncbi:asparagine synthase [Clostridiaceae bacterium M8S5]|nr:asparagine synthase [Clostridiaceae bacterium M8S5]
MRIREGMIPTVLGTAVTVGGILSKKVLPKQVAWGIVGFGLAHVVLGGIDLFEHHNCDFTDELFD